jgi:hypothetical protein
VAVLIQAYLLKYDSTHGRIKSDVHAIDDKTIQVGSQTIKVFASRYTFCSFGAFEVFLFETKDSFLIPF